MEEAQVEAIRGYWPDHLPKVRVLGVPNAYDPKETELRQLLTPKLRALLE